MANRPKSASKTLALVLGGSDSGPGGGARVRAYGGAPTLYSTNRGEKALADAQPDTGRLYPPVYGEGKQISLNTKRTSKKNRGCGYNPSASDLTNSPNPF